MSITCYFSVTFSLNPLGGDVLILEIPRHGDMSVQGNSILRRLS